MNTTQSSYLAVNSCLLDISRELLQSGHNEPALVGGHLYVAAAIVASSRIPKEDFMRACEAAYDERAEAVARVEAEKER